MSTNLEAYNGKLVGAMGNANLISDEYDNTTTYAVGDYCIYENVLYKCTTAVTAAEDFDSTKWTATTVDAELSQINTNLSELSTTTNTIGYNVDLTPYNSNTNQYTTPRDGYVFIQNTSGQNGTLNLYDSGLIIGRAEGAFSMFVKKGCKIWLSGTATYAYFRSFN